MRLTKLSTHPKQSASRSLHRIDSTPVCSCGGQARRRDWTRGVWRAIAATVRVCERRVCSEKQNGEFGDLVIWRLEILAGLSVVGVTEASLVGVTRQTGCAGGRQGYESTSASATNGYCWTISSAVAPAFRVTGSKRGGVLARPRVTPAFEQCGDLVGGHGPIRFRSRQRIRRVSPATRTLGPHGASGSSNDAPDGTYRLIAGRKTHPGSVTESTHTSIT